MDCNLIEGFHIHVFIFMHQIVGRHLLASSESFSKKCQLLSNSYVGSVYIYIIVFFQACPRMEEVLFMGLSFLMPCI